MSLKLDGIDLNSEAVLFEAVDHSANETLMENRANLGVDGGLELDGSRVLGEEKGLDAEMEGLREEIDVEKCENGSVGHEITKNSDGFASGLDADRMENKAVGVAIGGERDDEVRQEPGNVLQELLGDESGEIGGKMESEESDLKGLFVHAGNGTGINLVVDLNARQGDGNGIGNEETKVKRTWGVSNLSLLDGRASNVVSDFKGVGPNGNRDEVVREQMMEVKLEYVEGTDFRVVALRPKIRGEECQAEKEGEYYLSDLVWCKVRGQRWWPGQIFEPSAASEKAIKHFKKDSYLIAYFGDQTFAWNDAAKLKPFRMHFAQLEKQSNSSAFRRAVYCALAEISRRIEFGLSCLCLPVEQRAKIQSQNVVNHGIQEESSKRGGGDSISSATTFQPMEVFQHLKSLAVAPHFGIGRLTFVTARARLLAFNRWKGNCQLSEVAELRALLEKEVGASASGEELDKITDGKVQGYSFDGEVSSGVVELDIHDSLFCEHNYDSEDDEGQKKVKLVTDIVSGSRPVVVNGEKEIKKKRGRKKGSLSSSKKYEAAESISGDSDLRRRKRLLLPRMQKESWSRPQKITKIGEGGRGVLQSGQINYVGGADGQNLSDVGSVVSSHSSVRSLRKKLIPADIPSPEEMLSKLCVAASDPTEGYRSLYSFISLFSDFRNSICLQNTNARNCETLPAEYKGGKNSKFETTETLEFQGIEDSYWTDRIIQSNPQESMLFEPEEATLVVEPGSIVNPSPYLNNNQERVPTDLGLEAENPAVPMSDGSEEYSSTTLTLKFSDLESVPSISDLNKIFSCYGPLDESLTKVFRKTNCAKIVFKRQADAETAFSSAGKFSIFGPSLLSYHLKPTPRKASTTSKGSEKGAKSAKGKLQFEG